MSSSRRQKSTITGQWQTLNSDLLVLIFERLGVSDLITAVPFVCSSWRTASLDGRCWRSLDFREWDHICGRIRRNRREFNVLHFPRLLSLAAERSNGFLESIYFPYFADDVHLLCIADRCPGLLYFSLPSAEVDEKKLCVAISTLHSLRGMAVDESLIRSDVLNHVSQICNNFTELKVFANYVNEEIASIICKSLPQLKKLVITDCAFTTQAMITLLDGLSFLEHMDISGYERSAVTNVVLQKASRLKHFIWNSKFELGDVADCSNCDQDHIRKSCECMMEHKIMEWLTELS